MEVSYSRKFEPKVLNVTEYSEYNKTRVDELNLRYNTFIPAPQINLSMYE